MHGSGKAYPSVGVDRQHKSLLVLRFNVRDYGANLLSSMSLNQYLQLKIINPQRHRPIRQSRGRPAVLSECNKEDLRCRRRRHTFLIRPSAPHEDISCVWFSCTIQSLITRSPCSFVLEHLCKSHCVGPLVVASELHVCPLGFVFPYICNSVSQF